MTTIQINGWSSFREWADAGYPGAVGVQSKPIYTDWAEGQCVDCGAYCERMDVSCRACAYHRPARSYGYQPYSRGRR